MNICTCLCHWLQKSNISLYSEAMNYFTIKERIKKENGIFNNLVNSEKMINKQILVIGSSNIKGLKMLSDDMRILTKIRKNKNKIISNPNCNYIDEKTDWSNKISGFLLDVIHSDSICDAIGSCIIPEGPKRPIIHNLLYL